MVQKLGLWALEEIFSSGHLSRWDCYPLCWNSEELTPLKVSKLPSQQTGCSTCKTRCQTNSFLDAHLLAGGFKICSLKSRLSAPEACNTFQKAGKFTYSLLNNLVQWPPARANCQQNTCAQLYSHIALPCATPFSKSHQSKVAPQNLHLDNYLSSFCLWPKSCSDTEQMR